MSVATAVFTVSKYPEGVDFTGRRYIYHGPIVITASPGAYSKGGIPITFPSGTNDMPGTTNQFCKTGRIDSRAGSGFVYLWTQADLWTADMKGNTVAVGQAIVDGNSNIQQCTTGGTAGSGAEPIWAIPSDTTPNPTTVDGTVTWTCKGPSNGIVQIFEQNGSTGALVELAQAAAIPSGVSGDTIAGQLEYMRG